MHEQDSPKKMNEAESAGESPVSGPVGPSPELQAIEAEWSRLRPRADRIDRDRLMFLAGQASVAGRVDQLRPARLATWFWPTSCAGMTTVAAVLFAILVLRPESRIAERAVNQAQPSATRDWNARPEAAGDAEFGVARASDGTVARGTWTAGMALRLGSDLLALAPVPELSATAPADDSTGEQPILSRRSLRALLDRDEDSSSYQRRSNGVEAAGARL
jgi:hypothetical protein